VSEFVKRGEDAAEVEVTLCSETPGRSLVVWRRIKKDNTSDWKLNGEEARPVPRPTAAPEGTRLGVLGRERHALQGVYQAWWLSAGICTNVWQWRVYLDAERTAGGEEKADASHPRTHAGVSVGMKKVEEAIAKLNVQLDNLCQFLPQDRVVAFAQLKPTELLLETEKAIGDAELLKMHNELINHRNDIKGLETVR